jgi:cytoskeleton protein RodZ
VTPPVAETKSDKLLRESEKTLGQLIGEARKRRGLSPEEVVRETRIPAHYVKMIESDTGALISDQLYLLPFLRRYAAFLGLDAEEIASRFVHDVQRAETNVTRMSEPIRMVEKKEGSRWIRVFFIVILGASAVLAAYLLWNNYDDLKRMVLPSAAQPQQARQPAALAPPPIVGEPPAAAPAQPESGAPPASETPPE